MPVQTIAWEGGHDGHVRLIEQTLLPLRHEVLEVRTVAAMFDAVLSTTRWFAGKRPQSPERVGDALADLFLGGLVVD